MPEDHGRRGVPHLIRNPLWRGQSAAKLLVGEGVPAGVRTTLANAGLLQVADPLPVPQYVRGPLRFACGGVVEDKPHALFPNRPVVALDDLDQFRRQLPGEPLLRLQRAKGRCKQLHLAVDRRVLVTLYCPATRARRISTLPAAKSTSSQAKAIASLTRGPDQIMYCDRLISCCRSVG